MYCDSIPYELAVKLKEKGTPIFIEQEWYPNGMPKAEKDCHKPMTTYAQVFDWFAEKGIGIGISNHWSGIVYQGYDWRVCQYNKTITPYFDTTYGTWNEAASAAIEKALELIK